jgi:hypothetical protein
VIEGRGPGLRVEVELRVRPRFGATLVTLHERALDGPAARLPGPLLDVALRVRGRRVLARLRRVAGTRLRAG